MLHEICKQGNVQAVQRKQHGDDRDHQLRLALPNAGIGFAVILSHDLIDVRRGTKFNVLRLIYVDLRILF